MKICDNCGHLNTKFEVVNKKPICGECGKPIGGGAQCKPTRKTDGAGQPKDGKTNKLNPDYDFSNENN
jgi:hypothetical protein